MKTLRLIILAACLSLVGCETIANYQPRTAFGKSVKAYWSRAETREGAKLAGKFVWKTGRDIAARTALQMFEAWASGQPVTWASVGEDLKQSAIRQGVDTLYTQANYIRTIQGTAQVLDPIATAELLAEAGSSQEFARSLAKNLFDNATEMLLRGESPNRASEANAAGLDKAASDLQARAGAPL